MQLEELKEKYSIPFGSVHVVLAENFSKLRQVSTKPIYLTKALTLCDENVYTFLELRTNHRLKEDPS